MNQATHDPAPTSPIEPVQLHAGDSLRFRCRKGIACFNKCCANIDILLTPWDIVRMARHFGISSREAIDQYTVDFAMDGKGMPGLKLRQKDGSTACMHLTADGCGIYADRPAACRYYALGTVALRKTDSSQIEDSYFVVREAHCLGHEEPHEQTIAQYRAEQGVDEYDVANSEWRAIVLKKRSSGPTVGTAPPRSFELFFLASYDLDGFRRFVASEQFAATFDVVPEVLAEVERDDLAALRFAMRFLRQALFGEVTVAVHPGVAQKRRSAYRERLARAAEGRAARLANAQDEQYESLKLQP